jgi:signal transduction histidine kinase
MSIAAILIVEDENIVALDMKMRLESLGYRVMGVVDSGAAALEFLSASTPDLVLMDIKLKGNVDGIETARLARERLDVPIIFVTAFTDEQTLDRAKLASPYGYIVKPFHERELRIAIELALYKFQYELSMRRSKELAEEANRVKGEFLANVSHELKTPLNSVIGFTELSLDKSVDDEQRDYLTTVLRSARSLVTLIDSILDFSRLENGKLSPVFAPFTLDSLLGECVDLLAVGACSKGLEVSYRRDPVLPEIIVSDRSRLRQVLMNLVDNAVKFTDKGRIRIRAEMADELPPGRLPRGVLEASSLDESRVRPFGLRLVVADTGIGMPPEKIAFAFERFTQLDGSRTRQAGGTGIGLAIVAKSVESLGGTVNVTSAPGQGSSFELVIPVIAAGPEAEATGLPLRGRHFVHVGFDPEASADIEELISAMGGAAMGIRDLRSVDGKGHAFVLAHERVAISERAELGRLRGKVVAACRPGFAGRSGLAEFGCAVVPLPLRRGALLDALEELQKSSYLANAPAPDGKAARRAPAEGKGTMPALMNEARVELGRYIDAISAGLDARNLEAIEQDSKAYNERFRALGAGTEDKLSFSALLFSRKGDWSGLEELLQKLKLLLDPEPSGRKSGR